MTRATPHNPFVYLTLSQSPLTTEMWGTAENPDTAEPSSWPPNARRDEYRVILRGEVLQGKLQYFIPPKPEPEQFESLTVALSNQPFVADDIAKMCTWLESTSLELREEREQNEKRAAKQKDDFFRLLAEHTKPSEVKTS